MVGFTGLCPLENGVFDKVGHPVLRLQLIARAGADHQHKMGNLPFLATMKQTYAVGQGGYIVLFGFHNANKKRRKGNKLLRNTLYLPITKSCP